MKVSTLAELAGFACISVAAFIGFVAWRLAPGFAVTGACLLLVGYGTEDAQAALAVARIVDPFRARRQARKMRRAAKRAANASTARKAARDAANDTRAMVGTASAAAAAAAVAATKR